MMDINCAKCLKELCMIQRSDTMHPACAAGVEAKHLTKQEDGTWR